MKDLRVFLAMVTKLMKWVKQTDFIGAYLQAKATGSFFITLPDIFKQFPPYLSKYFGHPLQ
eukprot:15365311-Ditylum_brightwellii.AAC.1